MSEMRAIQFASQEYEARSPFVAMEECQNLYLEANPATAKGPVALIGSPGLKLLGSAGNGPIRGINRMRSGLFIVSGTTLYRMDQAFEVKNLGTISGYGNVYMVNDGSSVLIVTNDHAYAASETEILDLPERNMVGAAYQDGYGIMARRQTEQFYISDLLEDGGVTSGWTDASTADTFADFLVGIISDHRELWLFGETTTEVWQNTGNAAFPFERAGAGFMERGCAAGGSVAKANNQVFWLGDDLSVYTAGGYQPQKISTHAIDKAIQGATTPGTAWAFVYTQEGHTFYVLNFTNLTVCFDLATGRWSTRKSDGIGRWRANNHAWIWNRHVVGDYESGKIYELDLDTYDEDGAILERRAVAPPIHNAGNRVIMDELYLDMETGIGLSGEQRTFNVIDYDDLASATATVTVDGAATTVTEGTDFDAEIDNFVTAKNLAAALVAKGISAKANATYVIVTAPQSTTLTIASSSAADLSIATDPLGSAPLVNLDWTDDGGHTWADDLTMSAGLVGDYLHRVRWHRLGAFRNRMLRITIQDPVRVAIISAMARLEGLDK